MKAEYFNEGGSVIKVTHDDGRIECVKEVHPLWEDVVGIAEPYAAPVVDQKVARANALASLDPLVAQITRYEILGIDAGIAKAKLTAKVAEIDQKYPV